jgi:hypothetical protein
MPRCCHECHWRSSLEAPPVTGESQRYLKKTMTGWWFQPTPWKMMDFVSWDPDIPNWMESHKIPWFQTTKQMMTQWKNAKNSWPPVPSEILLHAQVSNINTTSKPRRNWVRHHETSLGSWRLSPNRSCLLLLVCISPFTEAEDQP